MKRLSQKILIFFVTVTLLFIWVNSMLPSDLSGQESGWVQKLLQPVLDWIYNGRIQAGLAALAARLPAPLARAALGLAAAAERLLARGPEFLVRKAAHFSEYMLLGFLMGLLCVSRDGRRRFFLPEGACLAAALIDEGIQFFSEGRAPQLRDVCIDLSGATLGLLVGLLLLSVLWFFGKKRESPGKFS